MLLYIGAHQIFFLHNRLFNQNYFFPFTSIYCGKILNAKITNDNKSFMNNSSDTESSHSSDFGDLLKPKKRRTHKWLLMFKASLNGVNLLCHFKMSLIVNIAASKQININFEIKMGYLVQAAMRSEGRKYYGQWI